MSTPRLVPRLRLAALCVFGVALTAVPFGCAPNDDEQTETSFGPECGDWSWDPGAYDYRNANTFEFLWDAQGGVDAASEQCGHAYVAEYLDYVTEEPPRLTGKPPKQKKPRPSAPDASAPDTSVADALTDRGITADDVRQLGAVADATGYGLGTGTTLPFEQAENFAFVVLMTCDSVAEGSMTWDQAVAEDMASGAPAGAAREMNGYLRDTFCASLD